MGRTQPQIVSGNRESWCEIGPVGRVRGCGGSDSLVMLFGEQRAAEAGHGHVTNTGCAGGAGVGERGCDVLINADLKHLWFGVGKMKPEPSADLLAEQGPSRGL
jgi:hypothetical protein